MSNLTLPMALAALLQRDCAACGRTCNLRNYNFVEWQKGAGIARCKSCAAAGAELLLGGLLLSGGTNTAFAQATKRYNQATAAEYYDEDLEKPFAEGSFKWAAKGIYSEGDRKGQPCVCKGFKKGSVYEEHYFDTDLETVNEAIRLVSIWNAQKIIDRPVKVNVPEVWTFDANSTKGWAGKKIMQEPFIENYIKFNSGSGWNETHYPWARAMQALSHFSYHVTNGRSLLCDLQGAVYRDGVILTDPAIMSMNQRRYGPTDLGAKGISTFFARHTCTEFCRSNWLRPSDQTCYYEKRRGTTMKHLSSRISRKRMSTQLDLPAKKRHKSGFLKTVDDDEEEEEKYEQDNEDGDDDEEWQEGDDE